MRSLHIIIQYVIYQINCIYLLSLRYTHTEFKATHSKQFYPLQIKHSNKYVNITNYTVGIVAVGILPMYTYNEKVGMNGHFFAGH